eukprot:3939688-Prorocentrum_lima.AAC.1
MPILTAVQEGRHCCTGLMTQLANYVCIGDNRKLPGGVPRSAHPLSMKPSRKPWKARVENR